MNLTCSQQNNFTHRKVSKAIQPRNERTLLEEAMVRLYGDILARDSKTETGKFLFSGALKSRDVNAPLGMLMIKHAELMLNKVFHFKNE